MASVGFLHGGSNGNGDGFVLAALGFRLVEGQLAHELHLFQSERGTWAKNMLALGNHCLSNVEKVMSDGGSKLSFVDLLNGILVCDVLMDKPTYRLISLPKLLLNNQSDNQLCSLRLYRVMLFSVEMVSSAQSWKPNGCP